MYRVSCVCVAGILAAGMIFGADRAAVADALVGGDKPFDRFLLFAGFDLWRNGGSAHQGFLWSPGGLDREGFTFKLLIAEGLYHYRSGTNDIEGRYGLASPMAGWRFKRDRSEFTLFVGPDFQAHRLSPDDPGNRMRGNHAGLRVGAEGWYQPSDWFMANAAVSASTIGTNYWVRGAVGWQVSGLVWLGPEVTAFGGDRYRQYRAGVHATAFRWGPAEFSTGVGYARDSDDRDGFYVRLGVIARR